MHPACNLELRLDQKIKTSVEPGNIDEHNYKYFDSWSFICLKLDNGRVCKGLNPSDCVDVSAQPTIPGHPVRSPVPMVRL